MKEMLLTNESIDQMISFEIGGEFPGDLRYYNRFCAMPHWPGVHSGVTFGIGYDAGFVDAKQIRQDWEGLVNANILAYMISVVGLTGQRAKVAITPNARGFRIPYDVAKQVYLKKLPRFCRMALQAYPDLDKLNEHARGVIVGLVFNRGNDLVDNTPNEKRERRRAEMAALRPLIAKADYAGIAQQIVAMKRLWDGVPDFPGDNEERSNGLLKRRDREAKAILDSVGKVYAATDLVSVNLA
jgi:hypothetical protein